MSVKISGKKLHLKTFEIPTTGKNMRRCLVAQKEFAKVNMAVSNLKDDDADSILELLDATNKAITTYGEFLRDILNLSDEQFKKIDEEADFNDVREFAEKIMAKVLGWDADKSEDSES
ncbi:MAG: hypothetical protein J6586_04555 [Snodgrassella sp.]|nr:hypothetical protein [Snodgrassella sp.]